MRTHPGTPAVWRETSQLVLRGQRAFERGRYDEAQSFWAAEALDASGETRTVILGLATVAAAKGPDGR